MYAVPFVSNADLFRPQRESRIEVLTIREDVFRQVDDSVLSIMPSHLSSRFSTTSSDQASMRSSASSTLRYIPLSFENVLFSSYVYKRNYRPSLLSKKFDSKIAREQRPEQTSDVLNQNGISGEIRLEHWG